MLRSGRSVSDVSVASSVWQPLEASFVEAGRRAHVVWCLDGSFSGRTDESTDVVDPPVGGSEAVWVEPWRVADWLIGDRS